MYQRTLSVILWLFSFLVLFSAATSGEGIGMAFLFSVLLTMAAHAVWPRGE